jgi:uncharacterized repeat protein (TIGR01451 family)
MSAWKQVRTAAIGGGAVAVAWAIVALSAPAQPPIAPPPPDFEAPKPESKGPAIKFMVPVVEPKKKPEEPFQPLDLPDPFDTKIEQAGHNQPARRSSDAPARPVAGTSGRTGPDVTDPAHPVVTIRVRVPADVAPGDDIKYLITIQNTSNAAAHAVTVRNPLSADVEDVIRADPEPDAKLSTPKQQLVWSFGTLKGGASKTIELVLRHKDNVKELKNLAYVKFEHGEVVTTKIDKPTIKVTKTAPKQTVRDEPYTVRVLLENTGRVPAEDVRVLENLPASAELEAITAGAKRLVQPDGQQWQWEIAKLQPGERKVIEYKVTPHEARDVFTLTSVSGQRVVADKPAEARTQVLVPGLEVKLTGPTGVVTAGESAKYEIVVRNTGTLPSTNIKVTGTLPSDCKPTMKTDGGQVFRDSIVWSLPRLEPGDAHSFRFAMKANTTGRRVVVASASDARGVKAGQELATVFAGTAALNWETNFNPLTVRVGQQGTFTVKVKNHGGEVARNVRVQIDVPDAVSVVQMTPKTRIENNSVSFGTESIPGYGEAVYTLTFEGKKADQAYFVIRMAADCLGDRPMQTEKMVNIIGGPR